MRVFLRVVRGYSIAAKGWTLIVALESAWHARAIFWRLLARPPRTVRLIFAPQRGSGTSSLGRLERGAVSFRTASLKLMSDDRMMLAAAVIVSAAVVLLLWLL
jgi:hypothetical protein